MREADGLREFGTIQARLREASSVPELLAAACDAFEAVRVLARRSEDAAPSLFAAFMTAADAAVNGREAITIAPSLPPAHDSTPLASPPALDADIKMITDALAALGALLDERLAIAANRTSRPGDRAACQQAAEASRRIRQLMAREDNDRGLR